MSTTALETAGVHPLKPRSTAGRPAVLPLGVQRPRALKLLGRLGPHLPSKPHGGRQMRLRGRSSDRERDRGARKEQRTVARGRQPQMNCRDRK